MAQYTARMPRRFPLWPIILLLTVILFTGVVILNFSERSTPLQLDQSALTMVAELDAAQSRPAPEPQLKQAPTTVPASFPLLKVEWTQIGTARNGDEVNALPIPWERISFVSWSQVQQMSVPPELEHLHGYGDGTIALLSKSEDKAGETFWLVTGKTWYLTQKPKGGDPVGAYVGKDGTVVLYMYTFTKPWQLIYWRAEIKGLSP